MINWTRYRDFLRNPHALTEDPYSSLSLAQRKRRRYSQGMYKTLSISTSSEGFFDITEKVNKVIRDMGIREGICLVFTPHTTCAITLNENADPDVQHDLRLTLNSVFPDDPRFRHMEGNSHAHAKASALGSSSTMIIEEGKLVLGIWQGLYLVEFDGPRTRKVQVKCISG